MGRKRTISEEQILHAAETVVGRDGAAQLTLDAVATQAGVSKASILYYYGSKNELIEAVIQRGVARDTAFNDAATASLGDVPNAVIRGRLMAAAEPFPDELHTVALNLCSALAQNTRLRTVMHETQASVIARIRATSVSPGGAMLAYLALEGLKLVEILDFHTWPEAERSQLLSEIEWLVNVVPPATKQLLEIRASGERDATMKQAVKTPRRAVTKAATKKLSTNKSKTKKPRSKST